MLSTGSTGSRSADAVRGWCTHAALARIAYKRRVRQHATRRPWSQLGQEWRASLTEVLTALSSLSQAETAARLAQGVSDDTYVPTGQVAWSEPALLHATAVLDQGPWFVGPAVSFAALPRTNRVYVQDAVADLVPKLARALVADSPHVVGIRSEVPPLLAPPPGGSMTRFDWLVERETPRGQQIDLISVKTSRRPPTAAELRSWRGEISDHCTLVESQLPWSRARGGTCDVVAWVLLAREDARDAEWIAVPSSLRRAS